VRGLGPDREEEVPVPGLQGADVTPAVVQVIVDHPFLMIGGFIISMWLSLGVVVIISVEFALVRRLREIKTMFRSALNVAESYQTEVSALRRERKEDHGTLTGLLEVQGHQGDMLVDHEKRIKAQEEYLDRLRRAGLSVPEP
jgi:hypothetical protein